MDEAPDEKNKRENFANIPSTEWLKLSIISAVVYLLMAYLIFYFFHDSYITSAFDHGFSVANQLYIGVASGLVFAAIIRFAMLRRPVSEVLNDFYIVRVISQARLTSFDRTQLSLFAGVGEELLFRGAIQPLLGIWITSVIFVGLHGYFKFQSLGHLLFGTLMFGLSVGLGYLFEYIGLIGAMTAHATYDIIMLGLVQKKE